MYRQKESRANQVLLKSIENHLKRLNDYEEPQLESVKGKVTVSPDTKNEKMKRRIREKRRKKRQRAKLKLKKKREPLLLISTEYNCLMGRKNLPVQQPIYSQSEMANKDKKKRRSKNARRKRIRRERAKDRQNFLERLKSIETEIQAERAEEEKTLLRIDRKQPEAAAAMQSQPDSGMRRRHTKAEKRKMKSDWKRRKKQEKAEIRQECLKRLSNQLEKEKPRWEYELNARRSKST